MFRRAPVNPLIPLLLFLFLWPPVSTQGLPFEDLPCFFLGEDHYTDQVVMSVNSVTEDKSAGVFGGGKEDRYLVLELSIYNLLATPIELDPEKDFSLVTATGQTLTPVAKEKFHPMTAMNLVPKNTTMGAVVFKMEGPGRENLYFSFSNGIFPHPLWANLDENFPALKKNLESYPDDPETNLKVGRTLYNHNRFKESIPFLEKYLKINPGNFLVEKIIFKAKRQTGEEKGAFRPAGGYDPNAAYDPETLVEFADEFYNQGKFGPAIPLYEKALGQDPTHVKALEGMAWSYYFSRSYPEALTFLDRLVTQAPGKAEYYFQRGNTYKQMNKTRAAGTDWRKALEVDPAHNLARYNLAIQYLDERKIGDCLKELKTILQKGPEPDLKNIVLEAISRVEKGRYE